nr:MAG TPA: hypothetical protein [Caudoviricetes sp.]
MLLVSKSFKHCFNSLFITMSLFKKFFLIIIKTFNLIINLFNFPINSFCNGFEFKFSSFFFFLSDKSDIFINVLLDTHRTIKTIFDFSKPFIQVFFTHAIFKIFLILSPNFTP